MSQEVGTDCIIGTPAHPASSDRCFRLHYRWTMSGVLPDGQQPVAGRKDERQSRKSQRDPPSLKGKRKLRTQTERSSRMTARGPILKRPKQTFNPLVSNRLNRPGVRGPLTPGSEGVSPRGQRPYRPGVPEWRTPGRFAEQTKEGWNDRRKHRVDRRANSTAAGQAPPTSAAALPPPTTHRGRGLQQYAFVLRCAIPKSYHK